MSEIAPIKRALISVSDKTGICEFAQQLHSFNIEILSTGGTANLLRKQGIPVTEVADYTGFPEILDGRVKTLHPKIHGALLARGEQDEETLKNNHIDNIDLVVVNLYPFQQTIASIDCTLAKAIENIDIGGPTMIRAAAKNHRYISVVVDNQDFSTITEQLTTHQGTQYSTRYQLAKKAFEHTAQYDAAIANYLGSHTVDEEIKPFADTYNTQYIKQQDLRYGENPHQLATFYAAQNKGAANITTAKQLQGKELSFNNIADADTALECVKTFEQAACVIVKHANPCGVACSDSILDAYQQAYITDPTSAFGGIIAFNRKLDEETATAITSQQFAEVIIAPEISEKAQQVFSKKVNLRVLETGYPDNMLDEYDYKKVAGGLLVQQRDCQTINKKQLQIVTTNKPTEQQLDDLLFCWKVAKFVKSNAIVYAKHNSTIGIGAGQMSRVYSAKIAALKAQDEGLEVSGSVMASDAFFPFRDSIDTAAAAGITAIIQPGGSIRDQEVIAAADEHGIAMVFTGIRHFRH